MGNTILIADAEADIVATLADYYYHVMTAANGMEAIEKAGRQPDSVSDRQGGGQR